MYCFKKHHLFFLTPHVFYISKTKEIKVSQLGFTGLLLIKTEKVKIRAVVFPHPLLVGSSLANWSFHIDIPLWLWRGSVGHLKETRPSLEFKTPGFGSYRPS